MLLSLKFKFYVMEAVLGSLIAGTFGLVQSSMNRSSQHNANTQQYLQNKKLMEYQNDLQMQTWEAQQNAINEYNSPKNQIARLQDAGINPNAMGDVQGNYSSVSPEASVGLGSTNPTAPLTSMGDVFGNIAQMLLQGKGLSINQQDADTRKKQVDSSINVQAQEIQNLLSQKNKTEAETNEINKRVSQMDESLRLRVEEVNQVVESNKIKWAQTLITAYNSKWQEDVARIGAANDTMNTKTNLMNAHTAQAALKEKVREFDIQIKVEEGKLNALINKNEKDAFFKLCDQVKDLHIALPSQMAKAYSLMNCYVANMDKFSIEEKVKIAPTIQQISDMLGTKLDSLNYQFPDDFKTWNKPYMPSDVSDGF